jgi:bifunctional pyridoxal-dependent enzyme with beta-cystathionase and maltose regulon repressor activities
LTSDDWKLDPVELESKFSKKTKAIMINNPNNPIGKVCHKISGLSIRGGTRYFYPHKTVFGTS